MGGRKEFTPLYTLMRESERKSIMASNFLLREAAKKSWRGGGEVSLAKTPSAFEINKITERIPFSFSFAIKERHALRSRLSRAE
jgi:hypothetical protein